MKKNNLIWILSFAIIGMLLAGTLLAHHNDAEFSSSLVSMTCGTDSNSGCNLVNRSDMSVFLGLPVAFWGFAFYGAILVSGLYFLLTRENTFLKTIFLLSVLGFVVDIILFLYSIAVLGTVCNLCLLSYGATLGIVLFTYFAKKEYKVEGGFFPDFSRLFANRLVFITYILGVLWTGPGLGAILHVSTKSAANGVVKENPDTIIMRARNLFLQEFEAKPAVNIYTGDSPRKGSDTPVLTIVDFADFQCPYCKRMSEKLKEMLEKYPQWVQVIYKHYPLDKKCNEKMRSPGHVGSCDLSYASYCAYKQGKFWPFHDLVYAKQDELHGKVNPGSIRQLAVQSGLNPNALAACMQDPETMKVINQDLQEGFRLGVNSTPTIYVNNRKMEVRFMDFFLEQLLFYKLEQLQKQR